MSALTPRFTSHPEMKPQVNASKRKSEIDDIAAKVVQAAYAVANTLGDRDSMTPFHSRSLAFTCGSETPKERTCACGFIPIPVRLRSLAFTCGFKIRTSLICGSIYSSDDVAVSA